MEEVPSIKYLQLVKDLEAIRAAYVEAVERLLTKQHDAEEPDDWYKPDCACLPQGYDEATMERRMAGPNWYRLYKTKAKARIYQHPWPTSEELVSFKFLLKIASEANCHYCLENMVAHQIVFRRWEAFLSWNLKAIGGEIIPWEESYDDYFKDH